ncbi:hypothetical protein YB2330_004368 [Saitoella coloradoensis]
MPTNAAPTADLVASSLFDCSGLVAVITGGGTGIGLMIAQGLAANGAKVYIIGRRKDVLETAAKEHGSDTKGEIIALVGDITDKAQIEELARQIKEKEGQVNLLVNNAGISGPTGKAEGKDAEEFKKNLWGQEFSEWNDVWNTNVASHYFTTIGFLPLLEAGTKSKTGFSSSIINISSISGLTKDHQSHFAYNSSKAASIHLTRLMAKEFAPLKIRVNTIAPGVFPSEMTTDESDDRNVSSYDKEMEIPAGRAGDVKEMVGTALYLASKAGLYTNGVIIPVDGGFLLSGPSAY